MRALLPAAIVLVVATVLLALTPWLSVVAAVNYSGLCIPRLRYLSDDAKIHSAVAFVLDKGWLLHDGQPNEPRYESVEHYRRLVPDCCIVGGDFGGGLELNRFLGRLSDHVVIANVSRATVEATTPQELRAIVGRLGDSQHYYVAVSNCGRSWDPFD